MQVDYEHAKILLKDISVSTVIGCYRAEKDVSQTVLIDLELVTDVMVVSQTDRLEDALDYVAVIELVQLVANDHGCELLEAFAKKLVDRLSAFRMIKSFVLTIKKQPDALPDCQMVCLQLEGEF